MKLVTALSVLLCTEAALGARFTEKRRQSRAARQVSKRAEGKTRSSQPMIKSGLEAPATGEVHAEYSTNWAGAVLVSSGFTEVTGTVVVPTLSTSGSSSTESAGAAVSIGHLPVIFRI